MDETALPILLVNLARREKVLARADVIRFWPMVKKAATYLARSGPVSPRVGSSGALSKTDRRCALFTAMTPAGILALVARHVHPPSHGAR
jgi:hypothetical protein